MSKQIEKLLEKHGEEQLQILVSQVATKIKSRKRLDSILASEESAIAWFDELCKAKGLSYVDVYAKHKFEDKYGKKCLALNNWRTTGPYVYLWLNEDCYPHFEIGSSLSDIWVLDGYDDTLNAINTVIDQRQKAA